ncbi:MAG: sugar-binding protein, partial [Planctomycetota bacterium]|nr:sugar-binding protein [Planctomycetota bacterium]
MMNCRIERNLSAAVALSLALMSLGTAQPLRLDFSPSKNSRTEKPPAGTRRLECLQCAAPPKIDGEFDDAAWRDAAEIGALSRAKPITRVKVCFNDAGLYLAVTCEELPGRTSTGKAHERDKGAWKDDCIEVWVDPSGKGETSYQFIVSVAGSIYDGKNKGAGGNAKYDPEWQRAVKRNEKAWSVEIAIPMAALELDRWHRTVGFNVGRNGPGLGPRSWNPSYGDTSSSSLILKGEREKVDAVGALEGTVRRGRDLYTVGDALLMTLERPYARPGERWIEAQLHIRPNGVALEQTRLKVALFEIAKTQPSAEISATPEGSQGNLLVDLRSRGLREARLSVQLFHKTERLSATEAFVSAQDCEQPFRSGQKFAVKLDVPEGNEGLKAWPVTFGVPFPAGAIWDAKKLRLVDRAGKEIPHQKEVTGLWAPKGAIKWVRFDALVSPAEGCFVEAAAPGPGAKLARPVLVKEERANVILEMGAARYVLGRGPSPVEEVWLGGKRVAASEGTRGLYVVDQSGRLASASADGEEMKIEARGPVAACVRFEGFYRTPKGDALARHITRVEASAGQPFAKVTHTLVLTNDTNRVWFTDIGWEFAVTPGVEPRAIFGVSRGASQESRALPLDANTPAAFMLQDSHYRFGHGSNHFLVAKIGADDGMTTVAEGTECGDWGALAGKDAGFALGCKEAARQHPKE